MPGLTDLLEAAGQMANVFQVAPASTGGTLWAQLSAWMTRLGSSALRTWAPIVASGARCQVPRMHKGVVIGQCPAPATVRCVACGRLACLEHAFVDHTGGAICYVCAVQQVEQQRTDPAPPVDDAPAPGAPWSAPGGTYDPPPDSERPPPNEPDEDDEPTPNRDERRLRKAYELLGVAPSCSDEELARAYRRRLGEEHPDRHPGDPDAQRRFVRVQKAHAFILRRR